MYVPVKSAEFKRIINLDQRSVSIADSEFCKSMTILFRLPHGQMSLRPLQALALAEAVHFQGVLALLGVGLGKTLITYLLPVALPQFKKPLLIVPGALVDKTHRDFAELKNHWKNPENLTVVSYQKISRDPEYLNGLQPDLLICDECHYLKNKKSSVMKRIFRYWKDKDYCGFIPLSGTLVNRSFFEWHHLQLMALPTSQSVLPVTWRECEMWACALDEKTENRLPLGALKHFGPTVKQAREGFGKWMRQVPGFVISETQGCDASLILHKMYVNNDDVNAAQKKLDDKWVLPDDTEVNEAVHYYRHSKEISQGFYNKLDEMPDDWSNARREASSFIRDRLSRSRKCDTPAQITEAYKDEPVIKKWLEIKDQYKLNSTPIIFSGFLVKFVLSQFEEGIIWYEHTTTAAMFSEFLPTYGPQGLELKTGDSITQASAPLIAASIKACGQGFNLQKKYNKNIIVSSPSVGRTWEQLIGRTHRTGQVADEVNVYVIITNETQEKALTQAVLDAEYIQSTTQQTQKLLLLNSNKTEGNYNGNF